MVVERDIAAQNLVLALAELLLGMHNTTPSSCEVKGSQSEAP
jgi:hypothetical protein